MGTVDHLSFVVGSYAAAAIIIGALVVWVMVDFRIQRRVLADFELRGVIRRSSPPPAAERPMREAKEKA